MRDLKSKVERLEKAIGNEEVNSAIPRTFVKVVVPGYFHFYCVKNKIDCRQLPYEINRKQNSGIPLEPLEEEALKCFYVLLNEEKLEFSDFLRQYDLVPIDWRELPTKKVRLVFIGITDDMSVGAWAIPKGALDTFVKRQKKLGLQNEANS